MGSINVRYVCKMDEVPGLSELYEGIDERTTRLKSQAEFFARKMVQLKEEADKVQKEYWEEVHRLLRAAKVLPDDYAESTHGLHFAPKGSEGAIGGAATVYMKKIEKSDATDFLKKLLEHATECKGPDCEGH